MKNKDRLSNFSGWKIKKTKPNTVSDFRLDPVSDEKNQWRNYWDNGKILNMDCKLDDSIT